MKHKHRPGGGSQHGYAQERLYPRVLTAFREERFDREIMTEMGAPALYLILLHSTED